MSLEQIALTTNKSTSNVGDFVRKIGQGERGQVLPVLVTDASGSPYDLTNKKLVFSETKDSRMYVVDDGQATDAGKFNPTDPKNGKFSYTLQEQVYLESGTAWFDIVSQDGTVLDTTNSFRFVVIPDPTVNVKNGNYSSTLAALQAHYQAVISKTETNTQQLIDSLTDKINQAISKGQTDVANEVTNIRNIIQQMQAEYSSKRDTLNNLTAEWQNQSKSIQSAADQQRQSIQNSYNNQSSQNQTQFNSKMTEIESEKNAAIAKANTDFSNKLVDWQKDYDSWKSSKEADLTAQLKSITDQAHDEVVDIQKQIEDAKKAWDSIDFTKFVTGDQFKEAMAKKASGIKVRGLRGDYIMAVNANDSNIDATPSTQQAGLVDSGVLAAAVQALADAILDKNHYTKQETDDIQRNILDTINNKTKDMATTQDVAADAQRITALENAGFAKLKLDGFTSAADAQKWSADQHGISMFADEPETV